MLCRFSNFLPARKLCRAAAGAILVATAAHAQVRYNWVGGSTDWNAAANWSPAGGPPAASDFAQFTPAAVGALQPQINAPVSVRQILFGPTLSGGWTISGTGTLTTGVNGGFDPNPPFTPLGTIGLFSSAGTGRHTIDVGDGTATSLLVGGLASSTSGAMIISANSQLTLTGNTVAAVDNSLINNASTVPSIALRGGTLVLDNANGNPSAQRLSTGSSNFNMVGAGSALELRGAAAGTVFSGLTRNVLLSAGSCYVRTVQNGSGTLAVAFNNVSRATLRHSLFFENIGEGFVGDPGKPRITSALAGSNFNITQTFSGVISSSATSAGPWAMVTNRANDTSVVTGRWANYDGQVVASTPTAFTGDFSAAAPNTNVLYAPVASGTVSLGASPATLASIVFEPVVAGAVLDLAGNSLNTRGIALSGGNDMTVTGGNLFFGDATGGSRSLIVLNPSTALYVSSNLADPANSSILVGGRGFVVLTGDTNQINYSAAHSLYMNDGVLRVTSANFVPVNTNISFRGGTLEYDVSAGNVSFNLPVGGGGNSVEWNVNSAGSAGESSTTDTGSGGFSAFSTNPGNSLTVNLGGAGAQVNWNQTAFVTSFSALKFGSLRSNATVVFQNPLGLGTLTGQAYRTRNIHVTAGVGNAADKAVLAGAVSGVAGYDLVKTGTGVLELAATNTYQGNTIVREGELRVSGTNTGEGAIFVQQTARLSGAGTIAGSVTVANGGSVRGDSGSGTGRLTLGGLTVEAGGKIGAHLGASGSSSSVAVGFLNLRAGAVIDLHTVAGFLASSPANWELATLADGANLQLNGAGVADNFVFGTFTQGSGGSGPIGLDITNLGVALNTGDQFKLTRAGNSLALSFTIGGGPTNATWAVDADGNWSAAANWTPGVPNAIGATANFGAVITAPRTITVDAPQTASQINFNNSNKYTIGGGGTLTLDNSINAVAVTVLAGNHDISAPLLLARDATFNVAPAGSTLVVNNLRDTTASITKDGAGTLQVNRVRATALTIDAGRVAVLAGVSPADPSRASVIKSLTIAAGSQLDLNNNATVVDYTSLGALLSDTRQQVQDGRLFSTLAGPGTSIGYADNATLGLSVFAGQNVDATSLLIRYTRLGDANLDGTANIGDFSLLASAFNQAGSWQRGDFNHDGLVNIGDFSLLAANFNQSVGPADLPRGAVPEPSLVVALPLLAGALRRLRKV